MSEDARQDHGAKLKKYWAYGAGAKSIKWNTEGAHTRCHRLLIQHAGMTSDQAWGYCNEVGHMATGKYAAEKKSADREDDPKKPYGNVTYADPGFQKDGKKRYPLDTYEHVKAAWTYINQSDNASKYSSKQLASIKAKIKAAAKRVGMKISEESSAAVPSMRTRAVDFRMDSSGDGRTLEGYAAVFNKTARIRGYYDDFDEMFAPGMFLRTIAERTPVVQFDHGKDPRTGTVPIAVVKDLHETRDGLFVRAPFIDDPIVEPIRKAVLANAITGMSIRMEVKAEDVEKRKDDVDLRTVRDVNLYELGPVVFPAYASTAVSVRSILASLDGDEVRELVRELATQLGVATDLETVAGGFRGVTAGDQTPRKSDDVVSSDARIRDRVLKMKGVVRV